MIKDAMEKNEKATPNGADWEVLKKYFGKCFNSDGAQDLEKLKARLGDQVAISNERYELKFLGKNYARLLTSLETMTVVVPEVLRASHISAWAEEEANRLNPENGLCLSATYDAAFDRHLIPFDEQYRLIVSKAIKDHYTDAAAKSYFINLERQKMSLPAKFFPSQTLLEKYRALLAG